MSQNITTRMMQAEEEANTDIAAKSYQHTSAYGLISDGAQPPSQSSASSGESIHSVLLRRARAKELGIDSMDYTNSNLSQGMYRTSSFDAGDGHARKTALGAAGARKHRENDRHKRASHRSRRQQFNANGEVNKHTSDTPPVRQEFNTRQKTFTEPPGRSYNPYS